MFKEFKIFSAFVCAAACLFGQDRPDGADALPSGAEQRGTAEEAGVETTATPESTPEGLFLSLEDVVELVYARSPETLFAQESVRQALEQSFQQRATLLPQLSLNAQQTRQQSSSRGSLAQGFEASPFNSFGVWVEGTQTLFDVSRYANYRVAQLGHAIAELNYEVAVQDILEQAIQLYFTHLRDVRRVAIIQGNIDRNQALMDLAEDQFDAGAAIRLDVTRAEVRVATERRALMEARTMADDSILQLKGLLDIDLDVDVRLDTAEIHEIEAPEGLVQHGSMGRLLETRPEVSAQQKVLEQAELASRAASWQRLPSVELFGDWGYDSAEPFDGDESEAWLVGVRVNVPIFEGGRIASEKREAQSLVRQNEYRMRDLLNRVAREFRFAMLAMESRYAQIEVARDEIRLGREEVAQAEERYREGLADNRELIDAQQRLSDAENSHLNAIYLYELSRLSYARAIGSAELVVE